MADIDPATGETIPEADPVTTKSLGGPLAFWTALTMLSLLWAIYDEFWAKRGYEGYQSDFKELYVSFLERGLL